MATITEIQAIIEEAVTYGEVEKLESDIKLTDQGIDSLDMASVYMMLEEKFSIKIPDDVIDDLLTIDQIINYIDNYKA